MILPTLLLSILTSPTCTQDHRLLLVFAPTSADPRYTRQLALLAAHRADLIDRDLHIASDTLTSTQASTEPCAIPDARKRFHIASDEFTVLLIGKDGGEKLRQHSVLSIENLNAIIDAMPMRKEEMRRPH